MLTFIWVIGLIGLFGFLAYHRAALTTFSLLMASYLVVGSVLGVVGQVVWLLFLLIVLPLNITSIRQQILATPALKYFRSVMPEMSKTEQEALDAGTTWWEAELFRGQPNWNKMHNYPQPRLTQEEQKFLDGPVETVCAMTNDWETTHVHADLSPEVWQYLKANKFFAMIIDKKYGGLEFSAYAQARVLQKLTGTSTVLASTVGVPNSLGPGELLQHYGTEEQKDYYLPRLANGDEIPCFALTSPEAGSDAGSIPDSGIVCYGEYEGEQVLGMKLNFNKRYITLAPVATVVGLAFKLFDPEGLIGDKKELGITCALLPRETKGVNIGRRHFPLNVPFQNGPIIGEDVFVPLDTIIGGVKMAGQGWRMLVECLSVGRAITLPSNAAGGAKTIAMATGAYSRVRRQFKLPIGKMEGVEEALARIGGNAYMMDAAATMSCGAIDQGEKPSVVSAILKYHLTERMRQVISDAMDVHGGKGIMLGPNNYLGRGYQGAPVAITVEGANILTRNMIIYGQGAVRCHPFVLAEIHAAKIDDPDDAVKEFDKALTGHLGFVVSNMVRSVWLSLSRGVFCEAPFEDETKRYYQQMSRFSSTLAFMSDICMAIYGGNLKRHERISARLGDMLSHLYLASASLKRYQDQGRQQQDLPLLQWAVEENLYQIQTALKGLLDNMPNKWISRVLRLMTMPWGSHLSKSKDKIEHKIARILQTDNETRDRLGAGQFLANVTGNLPGEMEQALKLVIKAEVVLDKIAKASGKKQAFVQLDKLANHALSQEWISQEEAELLKITEQYRLKAINVDDFSPEELAVTAYPKTAELSNETDQVSDNVVNLATVVHKTEDQVTDDTTKSETTSSDSKEGVN